MDRNTARAFLTAINQTESNRKSANPTGTGKSGDNEADILSVHKSGTIDQAGNCTSNNGMSLRAVPIRLRKPSPLTRLPLHTIFLILIVGLNICVSEVALSKNTWSIPPTDLRRLVYKSSSVLSTWARIWRYSCSVCCKGTNRRRCHPRRANIFAARSDDCSYANTNSLPWPSSTINPFTFIVLPPSSLESRLTICLWIPFLCDSYHDRRTTPVRCTANII